MEAFERHNFYHAMLEAMREDGCPVCRLTARASHGCLDAILYEGVTSVDFRGRFCAARGFCPRHTREMASFGRALGSSILYREVMTWALARWVRGEFKPPAMRRRPAPCPVCVEEAKLLENFAQAVKGHIQDEAFLAAYRASEGLCVPHFEAMMKGAPARVRRALLEMERDKVARIVAALDEFVRKSDYRFAGEPRGPEGRAWLDAIRKWAGGTGDV